jgi:hypothetical protein
MSSNWYSRARHGRPLLYSMCVCVDERAYAHTVYAVASDGQGHAVFTFPAELRVTPVAVRYVTSYHIC